MGMEAAREVLKRLSPIEMETVAGAFARLREMPPTERRRLAEEALQEAAKPDVGERDPLQFARELLGEQLGGETAERLLGAAAASPSSSRSLEWVPDSAAELLAETLQGENPRITALVLAALRLGLAARVVSILPPEVKGETMLRLAREQPPMPEAMAVILERVTRLVNRSDGPREQARQVRPLQLRLGTKKAAEILRQCDRVTERGVVDYLQEHAPELAQQVSQSIFSSIEDLKWLDARSLQTLLRELEIRDLARALRGTSEEVQKLSFDNLSENAAAELKEEMEALGPTPRREVETAQQTVLELVRTMLEEERIQVSQEEEEDLI